MAKAEVKFEGLDSLKRTFADAPRLTHQEASQVMMLVVQRVSRESSRLVPVKTGTLKGSKREQITNRPQEVEGTITYGGAAAPYAAIVHERMSDQIKYTTPGTGPKYLEIPTMQMAEELPQRVAFYQRRVLKARNSG